MICLLLVRRGRRSERAGACRIAQYRTGAAEYYLGDALGSVRQMTDASGEITLAKAYEPFGEVMNAAGSGVSSYGFTGEWTDVTGLVNLRARYYAAWDGRFLTRDVWEGDPFKPISYIAWVYAQNNPIKYTDPSGKTYYETFAKFTTSNDKAPKWDEQQKFTILNALWDISLAYSRAYNDEVYRRTHGCPPDYDPTLPLRLGPISAFLTLHGGQVNFVRVSDSSGAWGQARSSREIWIYSNASSNNIISNPRFIVHEMGHAFENALLGTLGATLGRNTLGAIEKGQYKYKDLWFREGGEEDKYAGFAGKFEDWQWSTDEGPDYRGEIFADMFLGWVYNRWAIHHTGSGWTELGQKRASFMADYMPGWIVDAIAIRLRKGKK